MKNRATLARRYADSFLNVWGTHISHDDFSELVVIRDIIEQNRLAFFFLSLPRIGQAKKAQMLGSMIPESKVKKHVQRLFALLVSHKRVSLTVYVMRYVCLLYKQRNKLMSFTISSAHELTQQQIHALRDFLTRKTSHTVEYDVTLDKKLIAGIRMQSDTLLWEYSIRKQLASVKYHMMR